MIFLFWHKFDINLDILLNFINLIKLVKEKHRRKHKKHQLYRNIYLTETSTAPASDIPWGPLNIDRAALFGLEGQLV